MKKFTDFLFKFRLVVIIAVFAITGLCGYLMTKVNINSDISSYLPDDSTVAETMDFLEESFGLQGDAIVVFKGDLKDFDKANEIMTEIFNVKNVTEQGMWLGSVAAMNGGSSMLSLLYTPDSALEGNSQAQVMKSVLMELAPTFFSGTIDKSSNAYSGEGYFIAYLTLDCPSNDQRAFDAMDDIAALLDKQNVEYHLGGTAMETKAMMESALGDMPSFLIVAVIIIFIILLLTTESWIDPFVFLLTIGVSILINIGTNVILPSVSSVTFAAAAILQLALSIDYSIFLTHAYSNELKEGGTEFEAMGRALRKTLLTVSGSALTTIAGFCALFAMRFTLGFDLGIVLAKGILLSLFAVCLFQPCLILALRKISGKTKHKCLNLKFENIYKIPQKFKFLLIGVAVVLLVSSFIVQLNVDYYYLTTEYNENAIGAQYVYQELGSRQVIVVPEAENEEKQQQFVAEIEGLKDDNGNDLVLDVISMQNFLQPVYNSVNNMIDGMVPEGMEGSFDVESLKIHNTDDLKNLPTTLATTRQSIIEYSNELKQSVQAQADLVKQSVFDQINQAINDHPFGGFIGEVNTIEDIENIIKNYGVLLGEQKAQLETARDALIMIDEQTNEGLATIDEQVNGVIAIIDESAPMVSQIAGVVDVMKNQFVQDYEGKNFTFYYIYTVGQPESEAAISTLNQIQSIYARYFPDQKVLSAGSTQTVVDMEKITGTDFTIIAVLSAALILIIVTIVFRSILKALLVTLVIETGIFINLAIDVVMGVSINFVTYIIISAIQLGATVDYAILMTNKFREARGNGMDKIASLKYAMSHSVFSIIVSVAILASACLSVYFISSDMIIREITLMIGRGSILSGILVIFVVPSILLLIDGIGFKRHRALPPAGGQPQLASASSEISQPEIAENKTNFSENNDKIDYSVKDDCSSDSDSSSFTPSP